jgi:hypothetical protein
MRGISTGLSNVFPPFKVASGGGLSFMATGQSLVVSDTYGASWQTLTPTLPVTATSACGTSTNNQYTFLGYQDSTLFVGFTRRFSSPTQHCLWALNVNVLVSSHVLSTKPPLAQYWALSGRLCSTARDTGNTVYLLVCMTHYIIRSSITDNSLSVLAGRISAGYADGDIQSSQFNSPSSLAFHNRRLYVTDTGNCVIREIDVMRNTTAVVAGRVGVCQRQDGLDAGLVGPYLLSPTAFSGFFLFVDQGANEFAPVLRQFHAPSGQIQTIRAAIMAKVSGLLSFSDRIQTVNGDDSNYVYDIQAVTSNCPSGTMSREGNAYSDAECIPCGNSFYSSGGACVPCSVPSCTLAGQRLIVCSGNSDSYCGQCTNKPSDQLSAYTGAATSYDSGSDCPWVFLPPCPVSTYSAAVSGVYVAGQTATVCVNCPPWSTTSVSGQTSVSQCVCMGMGAMGAANTCIVPSPFAVLPAACSSFRPCFAITYNAFPFPITETCSYSIMDTPVGVCRCQPGEYIDQIFPKRCSTCPSHLYSPVGESCIRCPPYGEPSLDSSTCRCAGGTHDIDLAEDTIQCVCGPGSGFNVLNGCFQCPANQYNAATLTLSSTPWVQTKACVPCAPGTWSLPGASKCSPCPFGTYRDAALQQCTSCPIGQYTADPTTVYACTACVSECGGRKQTPCPTDETLYVCVDCPPGRAHSVPNGEDDCATACVEGFYELDEECVECMRFDGASCQAGSILIPCGIYSDAACAQCTNASKPLYYAQWAGTAGGPSTSCAWECIAGYSAKSATWVGDEIEIWMCIKENAWTVSDIFTV